MIKMLCLAGGVLAACCLLAGVGMCQVVEPPPLPEEPAEGAPEEPFLDSGETLPPKALLAQMAALYEDIKKQYKLHNYTKMEKRTRDLRNMAENLKRKSQETPNPTAFYGAADQLRNWSVKLRDATQALNGDDMYQALRRLANRFNDCYSALGEPKKVNAGPRYDPPKMMIEKAAEKSGFKSDSEESPGSEGQGDGKERRRMRSISRGIPTPGADDEGDLDVF